GWTRAISLSSILLSSLSSSELPRTLDAPCVSCFTRSFTPFSNTLTRFETSSTVSLILSNAPCAQAEKQ
ncbi:hypothetical protein KSS87_017309, partial [Heliosperma pusillum]